MEHSRPAALSAEDRRALQERRAVYDAHLDVVRSERGQSLAEKTEEHANRNLGEPAVKQSLELDV